MTDVAEIEKHVITCIQALYSQDKTAKAADQWLKEFQIASPFVWTVADRILHNTTLPYEIHFFAASTLFTKIQTSASLELAPESRKALRDSLISHINTHNKGHDPLRLKLAQSVAVLALHMGTEWPQVVPDLVATFSSSPELARSLFSILEVLPEESENYHSTSRVSKASSEAFRAQIRQAAPQMIRNLGNPSLIGNSKDVEAQILIMRCFANWLRACELGHIAAALSENQLVISAFDALGSQNLFESALAAVIELVLVSSQPELGQLAEYFVSRAQGYLASFKRAVKAEDEDTTKGLCHLFTEMAESYLHMMLAANPTVLPLAEIMLECVANTDIDTAAITFRFWQMLSEGLMRTSNESLKGWFVSTIFPRLFESMYRIACYPDDFDTLPRDIQEDFRDTRKNEVTTTLRAISAIIGTSACFAKVAAILQVQLGADGYAKTGNWRLIESAIFCMRALARCVDAQPGADPMVMSILAILPQLPNHKEIHYTSLLIVGRYAFWLKNEPALLWPLFSYVVTGLGRSDTAPSAAVSFKNICASCAQTIAEAHLQEILQIATNSIQSPKLHINDHIEILDGVSQVISALPFEAGVASLQALCTPLVESIRQHTSKSDPKSPLSDNLCKLATLFLSINTFRNNPDRTAPIPEALWPVLEPIFDAHATDTHVIDQLFRVIRYLLDSFPASFSPSPNSTLLSSLFSKMKSTYQSSRNPCVLYTSSAFLKYNARKSEYVPALWDLVLALSSTTLNTHADAVADSDLVGEYCSLVDFAVIDFAAQIRATPGLAEGLVRWCAAALVQIAQLSRQDRHQREAFYSICRLLTTMMREGFDFSKTGEELVRSILTCVTLCGISISRATCLGDLLRRLAAHPHMFTWIGACADAVLPSAVPAAPKVKLLETLAHAAKFPLPDEHAEKRRKSLLPTAANGKDTTINGKEKLKGDQGAEEAERDLINAVIDLADMCKKFRR